MDDLSLENIAVYVGESVDRAHCIPVLWIETPNSLSDLGSCFSFWIGSQIEFRKMIYLPETPRC